MATFCFNSLSNNMRDILPQERQNWRQEIFEVDEVGFFLYLKLWFTSVCVCYCHVITRALGAFVYV